MSFELITFSIDNNIAQITLNRPEAGNAFNLALATELNQAANLCQYDKNVRAVVISAEGKLFCAGGDLSKMAEAGDKVDAVLKQLTDQLHMAYSTFMRMRAPVVASVHGPAAGIGFSLALMADYTIASEKASFVLAYTAAGLSPDGASTFLLPRAVGHKRAMELILTNRKLKAPEALDWGIVNQVVANEDLAEATAKVASQLANGPTNAFGSAKKLLNSCYMESPESQMFLEATEISANAKGRDGQEGIHAFLNKRSPEFTGE